MRQILIRYALNNVRLENLVFTITTLCYMYIKRRSRAVAADAAWSLRRSVKSLLRYLIKAINYLTPCNKFLNQVHVNRVRIGAAHVD